MNCYFEYGDTGELIIVDMEVLYKYSHFLFVLFKLRKDY